MFQRDIEYIEAFLSSSTIQILELKGLLQAYECAALPSIPTVIPRPSWSSSGAQDHIKCFQDGVREQIRNEPTIRVECKFVSNIRCSPVSLIRNIMRRSRQIRAPQNAS